AGARVAVIVGQEEWTAGTVTVRNMVTGDQQQAPAGAAAATVATMLDRPAQAT
ncbi:MAG: His/Gly/Thr/Pro-type tRNA ligase C-terminal domain-containing protein, partial [Pseudonocardiaceae bacterium]